MIRIPFTDLQSDYGLTALSLTSTNPNTYQRLTEACNTAWVQFQNRYRGDGLKPLRKQFANNVKKMRCIYNFFSSEYVTEDLPLGDNELAISLRLSKFAIDGRNTATTVNALTLKADSTDVTVDYRNVFAYSGKKVVNGTGTWSTVQNLTNPSYQVRRKLGASISWNFDLAALQTSLGTIDVSTITEPALKDFILKSKDTVKTALSGGAGGSIALLGMGYQAVKAICGEGGSGCKVEKQSTAILNEQNASLTTFVPNSAVNEVVRLSLIKSIEGLLDSYFETADSKAVRSWFGG